MLKFVPPASIYLLQVVLMSKAKVQLKLGKWLGAFKSAEDVLKEDKNNWRALLVKAESLFNLCHFERAMVIFYQGQVSSDLISDRHGYDTLYRGLLKDGGVVLRLAAIPGNNPIWRSL